MKIKLVGFGAILCLLLLAFSYEKSLIIKGKVLNEQGLPITGATIIVKETNKIATSDSAGIFSIEVPALGSMLRITAVGYGPKEVRLTGKEEIVIGLLSAQSLSQLHALESLSITDYSAKVVEMESRLGSKEYLSKNNYFKSSLKGYNVQDEMRREEKREYSREGYDRIEENPFLKTTDNPLSTFSIDVDAASYSNVRRMLNYNQLPPAGAVRIEEMINYFTYNYPQPKNNDPFSINTEIAVCPWNEAHRIVSIGLQGKKIPVGNLPASNLTFLIDVSGSMADENKLPLVQASIKLLTDQLREQDKVTMVVYAGNAGLVLPPTSGGNKGMIKEALNRLEAGGSTAGGVGIKLAYKIARENFIKSGNNRVILCTDGDFNVGTSSDDELITLIEEERKSGVFLTVLGYGMGNYQDAKMQKLANKGNGNHAYIDNISEARKVLVHEFGGTLFTIAKDVKLQVEFNPAKVQGYRLIGYENRMLAKEDFNNDKKDAGELGSGHTVTALYEVIPVGVVSPELKDVDELRYGQPVKPKVAAAQFKGELLNIKFRYKKPGEDVSKLLEHPVLDNKSAITSASDNLKFATAVAEFGMLLRNSNFKGQSSYKTVEQLAASAIQTDKEGYRKEFLELVKKAQKLSKEVAVNE